MTRPSALETALHRLSMHYRNYIASWFVRDDAPSAVEVALLVPLAPKDLPRAAVSVPITCARLTHPIRQVCIVSPENAEIRALCAERGYRWIDEMEPLGALCGTEIAGQMNGWIRQQMLKMIAPEVTGSDNVIAFDSDTYPLRPTRFVDDRERVILYTAERTREPYHRFTQLLTGLAPYRDRSFIAHCALFQAEPLQALRQLIETQHGRPWHEVVLDLVSQPRDLAGVMSEFEIYGTFLSRTRPESIVTRHRANLKLSEAAFLEAGKLPAPKRRFRFASSHVHGG